jgi:signal recognition particle subunit SRP54
MLAAADTYRPAAVEQLKIVGQQLNIPVYSAQVQDVVQICIEAVQAARNQSCDLLIIDTAGRMHIDAEMMAEAERIKARIKPHEILFVADGMTGQDAVTVAREFNDRLEFDGIVLTKLDGDTRGGAFFHPRGNT